MSVYTYNIPQPGDIPAQSQSQILGNFTSIDDGTNGFARNHVSLSNATVGQRGKHNCVELVAQGFAPNFANEVTLRAGTDGSSFSQFYAISDGQPNTYQLTRFRAGNFALFGANSAYGAPPSEFTQQGGWTFLPGGLLFQYGFYGKAGSTASAPVAFPIPFATPPFSITISQYRNSGNQACAVSSINPPTASLFYFILETSGSDGIYWYAVGS